MNIYIQDRYAEIYMVNNSTATTISTINTPVKVDGTTTNGLASSHFTLTSGRITYTGTETLTFIITSTLGVVNQGSGGNISFTFYIAKNGSVEAKSASKSSFQPSREASITTQAIIQLATNDYIEVFAENNDGTDNVLIEYMNFRANMIGN